MMFDDEIIPFEFEDVYHGLAISKGIMQISDEYLIFEFQTSDNIVNIIKSDVKIIKINYLNISEIIYKKSWFNTKIIIHLKSLQILSRFPNSPSELILKISKNNREKAIDCVKLINLKINEKKIEKYDKI